MTRVVATLIENNGKVLIVKRLTYDLAPADIPLAEYVRDHINNKKD